MKAFLTSIVFAIIIATGAMFTLDAVWQRQVDQAFTSQTAVRIPWNGQTHNLVGKDWYAAKEH